MWAGGSQWGHWPMDAAAYQNMSHEQVDWATLAQQWIRMKELHETAVVGLPITTVHVQTPLQHVPPPMQRQPSPLPKHAYYTSEAHMEKGEAPMEVDKEEPEYSEPTGNQIQWNQNNWTPPPANFGYPVPPMQPFPHPGYYTGGPPVPRPPMPIPGAKPSIVGDSDESSPFAAFAQGLDAAKRKQLPAWIREGLEKMERDKQKKEEREKMLEERELRRQQALKEAENGGIPGSVTKSRFDDSESESEADEPDAAVPAAKSPSPPPRARVRTAEEILQEAMLRIRRLMTEILLDVTTEEIRSLATEEYQRAVVKSRTRQSSLGSNTLTKNLGLDYGSDSDGEDDAAEQDGSDRRSRTGAEDSDSEDKLEQTILEKQRQYAMGQFDRDRQARAAERAFSRWERHVRGIDVSDSEEENEELLPAEKVVTTKVEMETGNVTQDPGSKVSRTPEVSDDRAVQAEAQPLPEAKEKREPGREERGRSRSIETTSSRSKVGEKSRERKPSRSRSRERRTSFRARRSSSSEASRRSERKSSRDRSSKRSRSRDRRSKRSRSRDRARRRSRSRDKDRKRSRSTDRSCRRSRSRNRASRRSRSQDKDRKRSRSADRNSRRSRSRNRTSRKSRSPDRRKRSRSRESRRDRSRSRDKERRRSGSKERKRSRSRERRR